MSGSTRNFLEEQDKDFLVRIIINNFCDQNDSCPDLPDYWSATRHELIDFLCDPKSCHRWCN